MYENLSDPNLVSKLLRKIDDLERRIEFLEKSQIKPQNLVSFTTVAVSGKLGLQPLNMELAWGGGPSTQVAALSNMAYRHNLGIINDLATRHSIVPNRPIRYR
nr:MAG TPA: zipper dimerization domain transcription factor-like protein [Caudoviricetes sp.]